METVKNSLQPLYFLYIAIISFFLSFILIISECLVLMSLYLVKLTKFIFEVDINLRLLFLLSWEENMFRVLYFFKCFYVEKVCKDEKKK